MANINLDNKKKNNLVFLNADSDDILKICTETLEEAKNGNIGDFLLVYCNKPNTIKGDNKNELMDSEYVTIYWSVKNVIKMVGMIEKIKFDILSYEEYMESREDE